MKVLVVDDDPGVLEYLQALLTELGHEVIITDKGKEVLKKVVIDQPDLVLLDVVLTDTDGLNVLKEVKEIDKEVSVVMMTAFKDAEKTTKAFELGADDYVFKPFNVEYIKDTILPRIKTRKR